MKYCLPLKEFEYSFNYYKVWEISSSNKNKNVREELLNSTFAFGI